MIKTLNKFSGQQTRPLLCIPAPAFRKKSWKWRVDCLKVKHVLLHKYLDQIKDRKEKEELWSIYLLKYPSENADNSNGKSQNWKFFWRSMLPDPLRWRTNISLVCIHRKSHFTPWKGVTTYCSPFGIQNVVVLAGMFWCVFISKTPYYKTAAYHTDSPTIDNTAVKVGYWYFYS